MTTRKGIGKDKELGPLSDKAPDGKRGYKSSGRARTTHLKEIKKQGNKIRRTFVYEGNNYWREGTKRKYDY